jgi:Zn-dependent protease
MTCPQCATELPPNLLLCPSCRALVHGAELKTLATQAEAETAAGRFTEALTHWRRALELLPPSSAQHKAITDKVNAIVLHLDRTGGVPTPPKTRFGGKGWGVGIVALIISLASKGKALLFGLTKASTFFSMLLSIGVYWNVFGWKLAVGLIVSIYIHEIGHIYLLHRYGIKATAPMFIPGLGAMIRQKQYPASPYEDARVGLAGPVWGLAAAGASYVIHLATKMEIFAAIAQWGALINLFNLLPVWQLDGSHAFRALSKMERLAIVALCALMAWVTAQGFLWLIALVGGFRAFQKDAPQKGEMRILGEFAFLIVTLSLFTTIPVKLKEAEPALAFETNLQRLGQLADEGARFFIMGPHFSVVTRAGGNGFSDANWLGDGNALELKFDRAKAQGLAGLQVAVQGLIAVDVGAIGGSEVAHVHSAVRAKHHLAVKAGNRRVSDAEIVGRVAAQAIQAGHQLERQRLADPA